MRRAIFTTLLAFSAIPTNAQATEKVILPVVIGGQVSGALGSVWVSEVYVTNDSENEVRVGGPPCQQQCVDETLPAKTTRKYSPFRVQAGSGDPRFAYIDPVLFAKEVHFNLRIRDLSRQLFTWGTQIPVVRSADLHTKKVILQAVPTSREFRQTLRVIDYDLPQSVVRVAYYGHNRATPIVEEILTLRSDIPSEIPAFVRVDSLVDRHPALSAESLVRVEVTPLTPSMRFWAFVSVTNNDTQHVTTVTPDRP